jgi:hypothetical protein
MNDIGKVAVVYRSARQHYDKPLISVRFNVGRSLSKRRNMIRYFGHNGAAENKKAIKPQSEVWRTQALFHLNVNHFSFQVLRISD